MATLRRLTNETLARYQEIGTERLTGRQLNALYAHCVFVHEWCGEDVPPVLIDLLRPVATEGELARISAPTTPLIEVWRNSVIGV